jgi:signal transduction histidine kinase
MLKLIIKLRILLLLITTIFSANISWTQNTSKKVLLINSYHIGYPWTDSITAGVISVLGKTENIDLYVENLDGKRYEDTSYFQKLFKIYQIKYKPGMFDIVILSDNLALDFSLSYGKLLYGDVPVVFCGVGNPEQYNLAHIPYYGVLEKGMDCPVLKMIGAMLPNLKNFYFISDKTQNGLLDIPRKKELASCLPSYVNSHFIDDIEIDSLFSLVKTFKRTDALLLISLQRDKHGTPLNYGRVTTQLCSISPAPVFCNYFSNIGKGAIGGCFVSPFEQGKLSADIALNILFTPNYKPQKILIPSTEYRFDYNVLQKFGIKKSSLPKGSILLNEPEHVYKKYKNVILTTLTVFAILITIIVLMIENIIRRKRSERIVIKQYNEIQKQNQEIESANQHLNDTLAELESINETLNEVNDELVKAKEHAEESDRLKTSFLQNMSHEIRTPMNAIMGFSDLLIEQYNNKPKIEQYSTIINQRCYDLLDIINDILDISKIESGQLTVNIEECDLTELFAELTSFFKAHQKRMGKQHIKFTLQALCESTGNVISTDKVKLKQIFINLISNAFKFTKNGQIEGGCKFDTNHKLLFYVSDTGIGIARNKQKAIFERFTQLNHTLSSNIGGTGLGLSIVKGLVGLLGGEIILESEPDKGSTFTFTIPFKTIHPLPQDHISKEEPEEYHFFNKTILLVEDDIYNAQYIKEILNNTSSEIIHCLLGKEAVQIALSQKIDIILMDIRLPDIDGYEATRQIRQHKPHIKIIAQTAYASISEKQIALDAGYNDYISKPINKDLFLAMIGRNLSK